MRPHQSADYKLDKSINIKANNRCDGTHGRILFWFCFNKTKQKKEKEQQKKKNKFWLKFYKKE